jgi:hypothetical protein
MQTPKIKISEETYVSVDEPGNFETLPACCSQHYHCQAWKFIYKNEAQSSTMEFGYSNRSTKSGLCVSENNCLCK